MSGDHGSDYRMDPDTVSLDKIKMDTIGRTIVSIFDPHSPPPEQFSHKPSAIKSRNISNAAAQLTEEFTCAICSELLYNPVALICGHSFCQGCLNQLIIKARNYCPICRGQIDEEITSASVNTALNSVLQFLYPDQTNQRQQAEELDKRKAQCGEMGGMHSRGSVEVVPLQMEEDELGYIRERYRQLESQKQSCPKTKAVREMDHGWDALISRWIRTRTSAGGHKQWQCDSQAKIMIRRNIVLDESDQRYQLCLGLRQCTYSIKDRVGQTQYCAAAETVVDSRGSLLIQLSLLAMEEDEVDDSGFPMFVLEGSDDEEVVCNTTTNNLGCIQSFARVVSAVGISEVTDCPMVKEVPLPPEEFEQCGTVKICIDIKKVLGATSLGSPVLVKLRFVHANTGAVLELRLPPRNDTDCVLGVLYGHANGGAEIWFGPGRCQEVHTNNYVLDMNDREEESTEHLGDVFLGSDEDRDEERGECDVCKCTGELIVCDGGENVRGCGKMYHIRCIGRHVVPPGKFCNSSLCIHDHSKLTKEEFTGDWICRICANEIGMDSVGSEGYEYTTDNKKEKGPKEFTDLVDSEEDNIGSVKLNFKRLKKNHL